jgi:hypothetical protein
MLAGELQGVRRLSMLMLWQLIWGLLLIDALIAGLLFTHGILLAKKCAIPLHDRLYL